MINKILEEFTKFNLITKSFGLLKNTNPYSYNKVKFTQNESDSIEFMLVVT